MIVTLAWIWLAIVAAGITWLVYKYTDRYMLQGLAFGFGVTSCVIVTAMAVVTVLTHG